MMSHTGQRDVKWPVIDPRVLRMGVSKIRMIDSEWLHQFEANGEIAVIQLGEEPLSVLVPYTLYQNMQAQLVGYHGTVPLSEASPSTQRGRARPLAPLRWYRLTDEPCAENTLSNCPPHTPEDTDEP